MPILYVSGDPLLTRAQVLLFGHNAKGRSELGDLETRLFNRYPAAFSAYNKLTRQEKIQPGDYWAWRESTPILLFGVMRVSSVGATRLRYVQSVMMKLARDYRLEGFKSLAIAPLGSAIEWAEIKPLLEFWLRGCKLSIVVYENYLPNVQIEENF